MSEIADGELKKKGVYEEAWRMSITHGLYRGEEDRQVCTCHHEELLWDAAITNEQVQEQHLTCFHADFVDQMVT